jgi:hypothetical protein
MFDFGAFAEVLKYAVKFGEQSEADTFHCYETLHGSRLVGAFGCYFGVPEPDRLMDDPLEGLPYYEYFYRYLVAASSYSIASVRHYDLHENEWAA